MEKIPITIPKGLQCLVADDHDLIRKNIAKVLRKLGFSEVYECHNGKDAKSVLTANTIDLVICDIDLNFISGFELLDLVRGRDTGSDVPFIVVTGAAHKDDIVKAADKGAAEYLVKPFQQEELELKITKVMQQYHSPGPVLGRLRTAEREVESKNFVEALVLIREALQIKDSPRGHHLEAVALMKQGQVIEAIKKLEDNIRNSPSYLKNYITLANVHIERKDFRNAITVLTQELEINPKQPFRQIKLANMLLKEGAVDRGIEHYRQALLENNKNPEALYGMGTAYALSENMEKAIYYFKRYRRHHPRDSRPLQAIVQFAKKFKKGRVAEVALLDEKKAHPDRLDSYTVLAGFYQDQGKDEQAFEVLEAAVKRKPDFAPAYVQMAGMHAKAGDIKEAVKVYKRYAEASKDPNAPVLLARFFIEIGKPSQAIFTLHQSIKSGVDLSKVFPILLHATYRTKQLGKAFFVRERLSRLAPEVDLADAFTSLDELIYERRRINEKVRAS